MRWIWIWILSDERRLEGFELLGLKAECSSGERGKGPLAPANDTVDDFPPELNRRVSDFGMDVATQLYKLKNMNCILVHLPIRSTLDALVLDHLDPVAIRIQQESHIVHPTVGQALLEVDLEQLEPLASLLEVIDRDTCCRKYEHAKQTTDRGAVELTNMAESLRLGVTIVVDGALLLLSAVVPGQLQDTFPLSDTVFSALLDWWVGAGVPQEVQVETVIRVLSGPQQRHAHLLRVELQADLGILDAQHGVVQTVRAGVRGGRQVLIGASDDLHPVPVRVLGEGNVSHASLGQLLLERVACILNALAGGFDVVHRDGDMAEAPVGLGVAIDYAVVGVVLGAVVVSELQDGIAIGPVAVTLEGFGTIVGEKVVGEFPLGEIELVDQAHAQKLIEFHRSLGVLDPHHRVLIA